MEIQNRELHRIAATAIIHKNGKYLIVKRNPKRKVFPGRWCVPGGGLEIMVDKILKGENPEKVEFNFKS
ncbi:MAG: NUDIX domain-containing protein [Patescibacteria group bacterium]|nr:NUDIX domain-containing protein [Patescibacteria group bacterium]